MKRHNSVCQRASIVQTNWKDHTRVPKPILHTPKHATLSRFILVVTCTASVSPWPRIVAVCTDSPKLQDVIALSLFCHHQHHVCFSVFIPRKQFLLKCSLVMCTDASSLCVQVLSCESLVLFPGGQHKHRKHRDGILQPCSEGTCSTCQEDEGTADSMCVYLQTVYACIGNLLWYTESVWVCFHSHMHL